MIINEGKPKHLVAANTQNCSKPHTTEIGRYSFERVDSYTYLDPLVNGDPNVSEEITYHPITAKRSYFGTEKSV